MSKHYSDFSGLATRWRQNSFLGQIFLRLAAQNQPWFGRRSRTVKIKDTPEDTSHN
jgi:hypothetical protein